MSKYLFEDIEPGDYIKIDDDPDDPEFYKVVAVKESYCELITEFGHHTTATYPEIKDLLLPSEMEYAF